MAATYWFTPEQAKKIIDRIEPQENGCWWYKGVPNRKGYAQTRIGWPVTKPILIHRLSWIYYKGDIPDGMVLDHICHDPAVCKGGITCEHRRCVNPDHLQIVTPTENGQRTVRLLKYRTHCTKGHSLENNTIQFPSRTTTICHTCKKENSKRSAAKARAKKKAGV